MVKPLVTLTARVLHLHKEMAPLISRIHSGFMVERNVQAVEAELEKMHEMLRQVRQTLNAPPPTRNPYIPLK